MKRAPRITQPFPPSLDFAAHLLALPGWLAHANAMTAWRCIFVAFSFVLAASSAVAWGDHDPLAQRDYWGLLHRTPVPLEQIDFEPRHACRSFYYSESRAQILADPAYVGAVQVALRRNGYYCGPINGIFSDEVSDAIARLQKGHAMRVNGALTVQVRRALFLP